MLALPPGFDAEEESVLRAIARPPSAWATTTSIDPAATMRLIEREWVEPWPGKPRVTFTEGGAAALGLRLDGKRWVGGIAGWPRSKGRSRVKPEHGIENETDAIHRTKGTDREFTGLDDLADGEYGPRDDGGHRKPTHIMLGHRAWVYPPIPRKKKLAPPCQVCGGRTIAEGAYCLSCDRAWDDKAAKTATTERRVG